MTNEVLCTIGFSILTIVVTIWLSWWVHRLIKRLLEDNNADRHLEYLRLTHYLMRIDEKLNLPPFSASKQYFD
jgi:hypothetical protein